jgi:hypothetical protein
MVDPGLFQEGPDVSILLPKGGGDSEQAAAAGSHRLGLGRFASPLGAQLHHPSQPLLDDQPDRQQTSPQRYPVDRAPFPLVPLLEQLALQGEQLVSHLRAGSSPL